MKAWHVPKERGLLEQLIEAISVKKGIHLPLQACLVPPKPLLDIVSDVQSKGILVKKATDPADHKTFHLPIWISDYTRQMKIRNFALNTQRTYTSNILLFYGYYQALNIEEITKKQIEEFLEYLYDNRKYGASAMNTMINAITVCDVAKSRYNQFENAN